MKPSNDHEAITLIVKGLQKAGCRLWYVNDGEDEVNVSTTAEAVEAITAVDMAHLFVYLPDDAPRETSFVWFVLGNEPMEVAADYGVSLSPYIDPIVDPWWE